MAGLAGLAGCAPDEPAARSRALIRRSACAYPTLDSADVAVVLTVDSVYRALLPRYGHYRGLYARPGCFRPVPMDSTYLSTFQTTYHAKLDSGLTHSLLLGIDPDSELYLHKYATLGAAARAQRLWERVRMLPLPPAYRSGGEGADEYIALFDYTQVQMGQWLMGGFLYGHVQDNQFIPNGYAPLAQDFFARVADSPGLRARIDVQKGQLTR